MEVRQETDYVLHHAQKILAIFAAMRDLARQLRAAGHRVRYVALDDASNRQSIPDNLSRTGRALRRPARAVATARRMAARRPAAGLGPHQRPCTAAWWIANTF